MKLIPLKSHLKNADLLIRHEGRGCRQGSIPLMPKKPRIRKKAPVPKDKALYARVKAAAKKKFDVYPSDYANAWLVSEYKKGGCTYA